MFKKRVLSVLLILTLIVSVIQFMPRKTVEGKTNKFVKAISVSKKT